MLMRRNGSPGLHELVSQHLDVFSADVFIASDGPRVSPDMPTIFLGARGVKNFDLVCELREGGHHSGNWGGLLANPGIILSHALASIVSETGRIKVKEWLPGPLPNSVKAALRGLTVDGGEKAPKIDERWGEPDLSATWGCTSYSNQPDFARHESAAKDASRLRCSRCRCS